jgi:hypothetical protein
MTSELILLFSMLDCVHSRLRSYGRTAVSKWRGKRWLMGHSLVATAIVRTQ